MLLTAAARRTAARRAEFNSWGILTDTEGPEVPLSGPVVHEIYSNFDLRFQVFVKETHTT
jgi:hypothetical protein